MFYLVIVFILIFNGDVSFLTNHFVEGRLICSNNEQTYIAEKKREWTYHTFRLPEGDNWRCRVVAYGKGYIFPSERDFISKEIDISASKNYQLDSVFKIN